MTGIMPVLISIEQLKFSFLPLQRVASAFVKKCCVTRKRSNVPFCPEYAFVGRRLPDR
jgi:hypothetical protein